MRGATLVLYWLGWGCIALAVTATWDAAGGLTVVGVGLLFNALAESLNSSL